MLNCHLFHIGILTHVVSYMVCTYVPRDVEDKESVNIVTIGRNEGFTGGSVEWTWVCTSSVRASCCALVVLAIRISSEGQGHRGSDSNINL